MGKTPEAVERELAFLKNGFPKLKIIAPATPERGVKVLSPEETERAEARAASAPKGGLCKFVPASGAASRMFKDIYSGLAVLAAGRDVEPGSPAARLAKDIAKFAFYDKTLFGLPENSPAYRRAVAEKLLGDAGLAYGRKPKGVVLFHRYGAETRTALAEHLVEAQEYLRNGDGTAEVVFTISPEHRPLFEAEAARVRTEYEKRYGLAYRIRFSFQDRSTDTIAVTPDDKPFRKGDGTLLFRPAGHGALIRNLNGLAAEIVSIKNIDNVAHQRLLPVTAKYKRVLIGECLRLRDRLFSFLRALDGCAPEHLETLCGEIAAFLDRTLCLTLPPRLPLQERAALLRRKLNRPIRVCGMVRNEGEPGGGPFLVEGKDGCTGLQILESVQIDRTDPVVAALAARATHFNPVDLVCCLRDYRGEKFDLPAFVDEEAGFLSSKSFEGRELKALELPGLWNGAMSDWNTLFVEVPSETFNPVKTVLDLLRPAHQG